jgi:hypothetical protein
VTMRLSKKLTGRIVEIRFADHCEGGHEPMDTIVYGRLLDVHRRHVTVGGWLPLSDSATDDSRTQWTIVRSAISSVTVLAPVEASPPATARDARGPCRGK